MAKNLARIHRPTDAFTIPTFLAPSLLSIRHLGVQSSQFSTTSPKGKITRDRNRERGVSALRRTGTKYVLPTSKEPLPEPVLDPAKRSKVVGNEKHGLWDFFDKDRKAFVEPENEGAHGRSWSVEELRQKSFEDLHCLWWVCVKERNRIATQEFERKRAKAGYGEAEAEERDKIVKRTMQRIKHALTERWYAYEDARKIADKTSYWRRQLEDPIESTEDEGLSSSVSVKPSSKSEPPQAPPPPRGEQPQLTPTSL